MTRKKFTFVSKALPKETLKVVTFKGVEGISRLYEFDITLVSEEPDIELKEVIKSPAVFNINFEGQDFPIHGRLAHFEQVHEIPGHIYYRAVLVPRLWEAGLYNGNQLFLDKTVPEMITEVLKQVGLTSKDYELKLARTYPKWEYICQHQESHFNFLSRWMEREGIYYFFEQTEQSEKLIITDSVTGHQEIKGEKTVPYSPPSGIDHPEEEVIVAFLCRQRMLPNKVVLKDYNYRKPSLEIKAEAIVDSNGRGDVYLYGEHFKDPAQGSVLAKIRAEELLCREKVFWGEGTVPSLSPGFIFELARHYRDSNNQRYLITEVEHKGKQTGAFLEGLEGKTAEGKEGSGYSNRFACIPATVQFRPERITQKPRFYGTMNAVVDAAGDGKYAEVDDQGRYKVILPFDLSGNKDGKASRWIRMAQPYSGFNASDGIKGPSGMHFPLHKGAEVLLTFVDGDPDRPIISSSLPNPETVSPVTSANQTKSVIRDNYGNEIIFDTTPGDEHLRLYSPHNNSGLDLGRSYNAWTKSDKHDYALGNKFGFVAGTKADMSFGNILDLKVGLIWNLLAGLNFDFSLAGKYIQNWGYEVKNNNGPIIEYTKKDILSSSRKDHIISAGDQVCIVGGATRYDKKGTDKTKNRSIIGIYPEKVSLTVGSKKNTEKIDNNRQPAGKTGEKNNLYEKTPSTFFNLSVLVPSLVATLFTAWWAESSKIDELKGDMHWFGTGPGILGAGAAVAALIVAIITFFKEMKDEKIEPVVNTAPASKMEMEHNGNIIISSNGDEYDRKITLQVGPPNADSEAEILMSHNGIKINAGNGKAEVHINKNGQVTIYSYEDLNIKSLGDIKMESMRGGKVKLSGNTFSADPNMTFDWGNLTVL